MDSIIALFILVIGVTVVFAFRTAEPPTQQLELYSLDMMNYLSKTKIKEVNNAVVFEMLSDDRITNKENTLFEQLAEFYYVCTTDPLAGDINDCMADAKEFVKELTDGLLSKQFSYSIAIFVPPPANADGTSGEIVPEDTYLIYENKQNTALVDAKVIIPTRRLVHGIYEDEDSVDFFGPYLAEVVIWQ